MTLKNNIEAIIIKWAYQIDEVLSRDSDEELNIPGIFSHLNNYLNLHITSGCPFAIC